MAMKLWKRLHNWWLVKRGKRHPQADELIAYAQWYFTEGRKQFESPYGPTSDWGSK